MTLVPLEFCSLHSSSMVMLASSGWSCSFHLSRKNTRVHLGQYQEGRLWLPIGNDRMHLGSSWLHSWGNVLWLHIHAWETCGWWETVIGSWNWLKFSWECFGRTKCRHSWGSYFLKVIVPVKISIPFAKVVILTHKSSWLTLQLH